MNVIVTQNVKQYATTANQTTKKIAVLVSQSVKNYKVTVNPVSKNIAVLINKSVKNYNVSSVQNVKKIAVAVSQIVKKYNITVSKNIGSGGSTNDTIKWFDYIVGSSSNSLNTTIATGYVINYVYAGVTVYRLFPTGTAIDAFYSTFSNGVLSGLLAQKTI